MGGTIPITKMEIKTKSGKMIREFFLQRFDEVNYFERRKMNMSKFLFIGAFGLVLLVAVLMIGCVTSTSSGGYAEVTAWYTISGSTISHNANVSTDWYMPGPGTEYRTLTWYCANYSGHTRSRIEITFKKVGDTWQWDSETYGTGSCS